MKMAQTKEDKKKLYISVDVRHKKIMIISFSTHMRTLCYYLYCLYSHDMSKYSLCHF